MNECEKEWKVLKKYNTKNGLIETFEEVELTVDGEFRYTKTKKEIKVSFTKRVYPTVNFLTNKKSISISVHIAVLSTFGNIPQTPGLVIDHINKNKLDYSLNNLRVVTISENNKNKSSYDQHRVGIKLNSEFEIVDEYFSKDYENRHVFRKELLKNNITIILSETLYNNLNKLITIREILSNSSWKDISKLTTFEVSDVGVFRKPLKFGYFYTLGTLSIDGYFNLSIPEQSIRAHRIIYSAFLGDIKEDLVIDHIDGDRLNNRVDNLRLVTQSTNVNNETTKQKKQIKISCEKDGHVFTFNSEKDCAEFIGVSKASIVNYLRGSRNCEKGYTNFKKLS